MKVLAAIADQEMGEILLEHLNKRRWNSDTQLNFVHVITWSPSKKEKESWPGLTEYAEAQEKAARELVEEIANRFHGNAPHCSIVKEVVHGHPGEQLMNYVLQNQIDETIVASHQRSELGKLIFGNVSAELLQNIPSTITIIKKPKSE